MKIIDIITMAMSSNDAQVAPIVHELLDRMIEGSNEMKENEGKRKTNIPLKQINHNWTKLQREPKGSCCREKKANKLEGTFEMVSTGTWECFTRKLRREHEARRPQELEKCETTDGR